MATSERLVLVTEPLLTPQFVQYGQVAPLASKLAKSFEVTVASIAVRPEVRAELESLGVEVVDGGALFPSPRHPRDEVPSYVLSWARDALLGLNGRLLERRLAGRPGLRVNFSQTTWLPADIWWIMGRPLGTTIRTIQPSLTPSLRRMASLAAPPIGLVDGRHFWKMAHGVRRIYTNSTANALWFLSRGVEVNGVLPHFLQSHAFAPTSARPSRSYILVYLGKETDVEAVKLLFQLDYPIKVFGSKSAGWVEGGLKGSRRGKVEMLGRVSDEELRSLYTHALFTAFPFTEEPFGLVPVESMACGTPVLTYGRQGPGETVIDGWTGWLVENASQFVIKAHEICQRGYAPSLADNCRERAKTYDLDTVAGLWAGVLRALLDGTPEPEAVRTTIARARSSLTGTALQGNRSATPPIRGGLRR